MRISDWSSDVCSSDLEFRHVDAERAVGNALGKQRQHHQSGNEECAITDTVDGADARADRRAEHHEVQRGRQYRRGDTLHQRAEGARHFEAIDRADRVDVHDLFRTRLTKISSSELSLDCRLLKSTPWSLSLRRIAPMPVCYPCTSSV